MIAENKQAKIKAVGYCRTSSERQRDNTSIPVQKKDIQKFAESHNYKLQKLYIDESRSGSTIEGRPEFKAMLADALQGKFDVIIVYDVTRLARDGVDIVTTVKALQDNTDVFMCATQQPFDTRNDDVLTMFVFAGVAEQEKRSILRRTRSGKIERAKEGKPVTGKQPWGRRWDNGKWDVDETSKQKIQNIARRYLDGEAIPSLADEYGLKQCQAYKILRELSGDTWMQNLKDARGKVHSIETPMPPLLDAVTLSRIHAKFEKNRTFKVRTNDYLLSGIIYCDVCGCSLVGQKNRQGVLYYRHNPRDKGSRCTVTPKPHVPAKLIETAVLKVLLDLFGNQAALHRAVDSALPNKKERNQLLGKMEALEERLKKTSTRIALLENSLLDVDQELDLGKLSDTIKRLQDSRNEIETEISSVIQKLKIVNTKKVAQAVSSRLNYNERAKRYLHNFDEMSTEEARILIRDAFYATNPKWPSMGIDAPEFEKKPGIYVYRNEDSAERRQKDYRFKIFGIMSLNYNGKELCTSMPDKYDANNATVAVANYATSRPDKAPPAPHSPPPTAPLPDESTQSPDASGSPSRVLW